MAEHEKPWRSQGCEANAKPFELASPRAATTRPRRRWGHPVTDRTPRVRDRPNPSAGDDEENWLRAERELSGESHWSTEQILSRGVRTKQVAPPDRVQHQVP
jgi:hypothetical protein